MLRYRRAAVSLHDARRQARGDRGQLTPDALLGAHSGECRRPVDPPGHRLTNTLCGIFGAGPPPNLAGTLVHSMLPIELPIGLIYVVMDLLLVLQRLM